MLKAIIHVRRQQSFPIQDPGPPACVSSFSGNSNCQVAKITFTSRSPIIQAYKCSHADPYTGSSPPSSRSQPTPASTVPKTQNWISYSALLILKELLILVEMHNNLSDIIPEYGFICNDRALEQLSDSTRCMFDRTHPDSTIQNITVEVCSLQSASCSMMLQL
jgi:hypothetical protein